MLINLSINNFAIFEKGNIFFDEGFNVITGETGSGKSIIIEALLLIIGIKSRKELIRRGKDKAIVEAIFDVTTNSKVKKILNEIGIEIDEDNLLIISRELLKNGKSLTRINGRITTLNNLRSITTNLVDIYGQFDQLALFTKDNYLKIIDNLVYDEIINIKKEYKKNYLEYTENCEKLEVLYSSCKNKDDRIKQLQFEIEEIETAELKENEEEYLLKEIKKLSNLEEIKNNLEKISFYTSNSENSALDILTSNSSILNKLKDYDNLLNNYFEEINIIIDNLQDFIFNIINYKEDLDIDEEKINELENRLSVINKLKRKYGFSIEKILEYKNNVNKELEQLLEIESKISKLNKNKNNLYNELELLCKKLTDIRNKSARFLEKRIVLELNDLNMKNIIFKVNIEQKDDFTLEGKDQIEFMISTNIGGSLNPLSKIISGGEATRIMLALKTILSDIDNIPTLIFDEIDTGVSGKTSHMAGQKIKYISNNHQVICITHSPQVASISNNHFYIEKETLNNETYSKIYKLNKKQKIKEIARLLSGINITDKSIDNAKELIEINDKI